MPQHKWAKEIKAWADGAEIEYTLEGCRNWFDSKYPNWYSKDYQFRIKPKLPSYGEIARDAWSSSCNHEQKYVPALESWQRVADAVIQEYNKRCFDLKGNGNA